MFCVLIIENHFEDFIRVYDRGEQLSRKDSKPRYTKVDGQKATKFKGWNAKGIKQFHEVCETIRMFRRTAVSMELESLLKERYAELYSENNKSDGNSSDLSSKGRDSDDESVDMYDGFHQQKYLIFKYH